MLFVLFFVFMLVPSSEAQSRSGVASHDSLPGKHRGAITALLRDEYGNIFSAGDDGYVGLWNNQAAKERFQISSYGIKSFVLRPGKSQIAFVETNGLGLYRISAWDYQTRKNLFTLRFRDSISYINYSAAGSFLIVARSGRSSAAFIHPETGEVLESPEDLSGPIAFAATGRSERTMICYLSSGILSYWDLESGNELQRFEVPPNIQSPVLFGNNRFLGGFDSSGLLVLDAVTGLVLARDESINRGSIFTGNSDTSGPGGSVQFNCLYLWGQAYTVNRMEINLSGRLTTVNRRTVPAAAGEVTCGVAGDGENTIVGTSQGVLWLLGRSGGRVMDTGNPQRIIDVAASSSALAFITESGALGYIPLDYSQINNGVTFSLEEASYSGGTGTYTGIISDPSQGGGSRFLLWQPGSGSSIPMLKTLLGTPMNASTSQLLLENLSLRLPLRSAAIMGNSILLLNSFGMLSVLEKESGNLRFSYSAPGAVDAAFIDEDTIILGRSVVAGNTPFMILHISTGETVPLAYPGVVGVRVYRGSSGAIYGAVINQSGGTVQTSIIRLNVTVPARSEKLVEFIGEDSAFAMTESGGTLASTLGGGEAILYSQRPGTQSAPPGTAAGNRGRASTPEIVTLERNRGLPVKIINGNRWFIVLDGEGGITWHDNRSGKLLAVLRLYPDLWVLEKDGKTVQGKTAKK